MNSNSFLMKFIDYISPILFFINAPLALLSGIWLLFTGGWQLVLLSIGGVALSSFILGILMSPGMLIAFFRKSIGEKLASLLSFLLVWGAASVWGYFVIIYGLG